MAEKIFKKLHERADLHAISKMDIQREVSEKLELLNQAIDDPTKHLIPNEGWAFTTSKLRNKISEITRQGPNHSDETPTRYKGLYMWLKKDDNTPLYVGISQHMEKRLADHVSAKNRAMATWAYMIAKHKHRDDFKEKQAAFQESGKYGKYDFFYREIVQTCIRKKCYCVVILEQNDYLLYLMEVYAAIKFKTHWNLFHTH